MTLLYKLTDQNNRTYNKTQWGEGVEHTASGEGGLCGQGWIHAYTDQRLAVLLNPIHAGIKEPVLWVGDGDVGKTDHGLKVGCTRFRTITRLPLPKPTEHQRLRFGILGAWEVYMGTDWRYWAERWLSGEDRSVSAARAAGDGVDGAALMFDGYYDLAAASAAWAARAASKCDQPMAWSIAWAARLAAEAAAESGMAFDLADIARRALGEEKTCQTS